MCAPTIARIWRGRTTAAKADEYAGYLYEHGIKPLVEKALGVQMLREDRAGESEFVTISYWESVEAMSRFAGDDPRRIHHLERDAEFLIELPSGVQVLDIVASHGDIGGELLAVADKRRAHVRRVCVCRLLLAWRQFLRCHSGLFACSKQDGGAARYRASRTGRRCRHCGKWSGLAA